MKNPQRTEFPGFGSPSNPHRVQGNKHHWRTRKSAAKYTIWLPSMYWWWVNLGESLTKHHWPLVSCAESLYVHLHQPRLLLSIEGSKVLDHGHTAKTILESSQPWGVKNCWTWRDIFRGMYFQALSKSHPTKPKTTTTSNPQLSTKPWIFISLSPWRSRHEIPQTEGSC